MCADGRWSAQRLYDFGFSRRFVLVRVRCLSGSEACTGSWGLFGGESCLTFDWWKRFLGVLGRSEVAISLARRLGRVEAGEFAPLWCCIVFFFFFSIRTHLAPVYVCVCKGERRHVWECM